MSNSRSFRRRLATPRTGHRFPDRPPALGTVRRWLKQGVAEGTIERAGEERTGKPGRPAHLWQLTAEGKERAQSAPDFKTMLTELQARRAHALMRKGMSEDRAIAAVTRGWR
jgi:predicted ArsR family transcriptional regulator